MRSPDCRQKAAFFFSIRFQGLCSNCQTLEGRNAKTMEIKDFAFQRPCFTFSKIFLVHCLVHQFYSAAEAFLYFHLGFQKPNPIYEDLCASNFHLERNKPNNIMIPFIAGVFSRHNNNLFYSIHFLR